jgi:CheY-like chemotaxis protein
MKAKVLIVDDDVNVGNMLREQLNEKNYEAVFCDNGEEALRRIGENRPDIIISDVRMPRMNGHELTKRIRGNPSTADIPLIFISAWSSPADQLEGLRGGADDYLCKPVVLDILLERMNRFINQSNQKPPAAPPRADFRGTLSRMSLGDALHIIESNRKSGELILLHEDDSRIGCAIFQAGSLIDAQCGMMSGEEAFYDLMAETEGHLEFHALPVEHPVQITRSNMNVLLQGMGLIDESRGFFEHFKDLEKRPLFKPDAIPETLIDNVGRPHFRAIAELIDGEHTLREILDSGVRSRPRIAAALSEMDAAGVLDYQTEKKLALNVTPLSFTIDESLIESFRRAAEHRQTGMMTLRERSIRQAVFFQKGRIVHAFHGRSAGKKGLYRLFMETGGIPYFQNQPVILKQTIHQDTEELLSEGAREIGTFLRIKERTFENVLALNDARIQQFPELIDGPEIREMLNHVIQFRKIRYIIDASPLTDLSAYLILLKLVKKGILTYRFTGR